MTCSSRRLVNMIQKNSSEVLNLPSPKSSPLVQGHVEKENKMSFPGIIFLHYQKEYPTYIISDSWSKYFLRVKT